MSSAACFWIYRVMRNHFSPAVPCWPHHSAFWTGSKSLLKWLRSGHPQNSKPGWHTWRKRRQTLRMWNGRGWCHPQMDVISNNMFPRRMHSAALPLIVDGSGAFLRNANRNCRQISQDTASNICQIVTYFPSLLQLERTSGGHTNARECRTWVLRWSVASHPVPSACQFHRNK